MRRASSPATPAPAHVLALVRAAAARVADLAGVVLWPGLLYLAAVSMAGLLPRRPVPTPAASSETPGQGRTVVLVPAHDEQEGLPATLTGLLSSTPPEGGLEIVVVADHCTDTTAEVARSAGVSVWERDGQDVRGKGAALRWALDRLLDPEVSAGQPVYAVAVVDADTLVSPDFFTRTQARLRAGAPVAQARYDTTEPEVTTLVWRLTEVASACQSVLRPLGRARLGGAAKLQGNGMVFRREVLERVPWDAYGQSEDVGYWFRLLRAGIHPQHEPATVVRGAMPTDLAAARVQRARWEAGRAEVKKEQTGPALRQAWRDRDPVLAEAVLSELVLPPLSTLAAGVVVVAAARLAAADDGVGRRQVAKGSAAQAAVLAAHVLAALRVAGAGPRSYLALAAAPAVVGWKVAVKLGTVLRPQTGWVRTPRPLDYASTER